MNIILNDKEVSLPDYLHIPYYLYQDNRLDKAAVYIASFFCALHNANRDITASTDYLCMLANIKKRQVYKILNLLEEIKYIARSGSTNKRIIQWIHLPSPKITIIESDDSYCQGNSKTSALQDTSLQTSALQDTKLVHSRTPNLCTPGHPYNKDNKKEDIINICAREEANAPSPASIDISSILFIKTKLQEIGVTDEDLPNQIGFFITKSKNKYSEDHAINIALKLIKQNKWKTPRGYNKIERNTLIPSKVPFNIEVKLNEKHDESYQMYVSKLKADIILKLIPIDTQIMSHDEWRRLSE